MNCIVAIGYGRSERRGALGTADRLAFRTRIQDTINTHGFLSAYIDGEATSDWGIEKATWFSVANIKPEDLADFKAELQDIVTAYGQDYFHITEGIQEAIRAW